jgi:hypothetical protein
MRASFLRRRRVLFLVSALICASLLACGANRRPSLLLVAPYHAGLTPAQDDPDTLRSELGPAVHPLRMLPRNVMSASDLRAAVREFSPDVIWIRGACDYDPWIARIPHAWKGLVLRSLPPARPAQPERPAAAPPGCALLYAPPEGSDRIYAAYVRRLLQALEQGMSVRDANRTAAQGEESWELRGDGAWRLTRS